MCGLPFEGEDLFKALIACLRNGAAAQALRGGVHQLDAAFEVADHHGLAKRDQDGPEALLGVIGGLRVFAQSAESLLESIADAVQLIAREDANQQAGNQRGANQGLDGMPELAVPGVDRLLATLNLVGGDLPREVAHAVHAALGAEVQAGVAGLAAGLHGGDDRLGDGSDPLHVLNPKGLQESRVGALIAQPVVQLAHAGAQGFGGELVGLQEDLVAGGLVGPQTGFFVDHVRGDQRGGLDIGVGQLDARDRPLRIQDLPGECGGDQRQGQDGQQQGAAESAIELIQIQRRPPANRQKVD